MPNISGANAVSTASPLSNSISKKPKELGRPSEVRIHGTSKLNGQDLNEISEAKVAKQEQDRSKLETVIEINNKKLESLKKIEDLTKSLYKSVGSLQKTSPFAREQGVFNKLTAEAIAGDETAVSLTIKSNLVPRQTIHMEVVRLASNDSVNGTLGVTTTLDNKGKLNPLGLSGTFVVQGENIAVTKTMNVQDIVNSVNEAGKRTNIFASLTKKNDEYYMSYSCNKTGTPIVVDNSGLFFDPNVGTGMGAGVTNFNPADASYWQNILPNSSTKTVSDLSCSVNMRGQTGIEYKNNIITDQGEGLNFIINKVGSTVLQVDYDMEAIGASIQEFVKTYNELYTYILRPDQNADRKKDEDILNDDSIVNIAKDFPQLYADLSTSLTILGGAVGRSIDPDTQGDITKFKSSGIVFNPKEGLNFAGETWISNLGENLDLVIQAFSFTSTSSNKNFSLMGKPDQIPGKFLNKDLTFVKSDITVKEKQKVNDELIEVDVVKKQLTMIYYNTFPVENETYTLEQDGNNAERFIGSKGSLLEGFIFYNILENDQSGTIRFSQGFADKLRQSLSVTLTSENGQMKRTQATINQKNIEQKRKIEQFDVATERINEKDREKLGKLNQSIQAGKQIDRMLKSMK